MNLGKIAEELAEKYLEEKGMQLFNLLQENSPVATGTYLRGHELGQVTKVNETTYQLTISNTVDYAGKVEHGWRKKPVNWHIKNGTIYHSVGANVYSKSILSFKQQVLGN